MGRGIVVSLVWFVICAFASFAFGSFFSRMIPGGDDELKWVMGVVVFIAGEIAACSSIIISKLNKLKK
jgi:hypothetical protein